MRPALYAAALVALAAAFPPNEIASTLASVASVLLEALPFLAFGSLASVLGCGCGRAGARALPVIAFTWLQFGPLVALARAAAALLVIRVLERGHAHEHAAATPGDELLALLPSAVLAALAAHVPVTFGALAGLALGFAGAPCALGGVALAASFHARMPAAALAVLCVSGVIDARTLFSRFAVTPSSPNGAVDACAAALCALAALRHGAQLVHPLWTVPLALASLVYAYRATRISWRPASPVMFPLAIAFAGLAATAPAPAVAVDETTFAGAYVGERLDFTGQLARHGENASIVRYAITCCRADAQPVTLRLSRAPSFRGGTWLRIDGTIARENARLVLVASTAIRVAPPADPFIYR